MNTSTLTWTVVGWVFFFLIFGFLIFFFKWWTISVPRKTLLNKRVVLSFRERTAFLQGAGSEDLDHIFKVWTVIQGCWAQPIASPDPPQGNAALTTSIRDCRRSRHWKKYLRWTDIFLLEGSLRIQATCDQTTQHKFDEVPGDGGELGVRWQPE